MRNRYQKPLADEERCVTDPVRSRERTMNRAVKLLAAKPRSIAELRTRLLEKRWTNDDIVSAVIEKLKEYKYLDDDQFAGDLALSKLRQKPQGRRKLQQSLSRKQISRETMDRAIESAFEKMPEHELLEQAIVKRVRLKGVPQTREDERKFFDHLLRQGFDPGLVRDQLTARLKNQPEPKDPD